MKGIPYSVVAASTVIISQLAHAGVKVEHAYDKDQVNDAIVDDILDVLKSSGSEYVINKDIAEMFAVDGKIEGIAIDEFIASSEFQPAAGRSAQCCHSNCHTNCHQNCHGSRSWR